MERIEIHPATWKIVLMIAGMIAFVVAGILMIVYGDGVFEKTIGIISIIFLGGFGGYALYSRTRGQGNLAILPIGIEIGIHVASSLLMRNTSYSRSKSRS